MWLTLQMLQEPAFWPDNLSEWVAATAAFVALVAGGFGLVFRMGSMKQKHDDEMKALKDEIDRRFTGQGERLGRAESGCDGHSATLNSIETEVRGLAFIVNTNTQEVSSLRGQFEQLEKTVNELDREGSETHARLRERLATVEAHTNNLREKP